MCTAHAHILVDSKKKKLVYPQLTRTHFLTLSPHSCKKAVKEKQ